MQHQPFIKALLLFTCLLGNAPTSMASIWQKVNEDLSEYQLAESHADDSLTECLTAGLERGADAVAFWEQNRTCHLYACIKGHGCRKCRNLRNTSLPRVWVKLQEGRVKCWKTFQHRVDTSVSFNRNWSQYVDGLGQGEDLNFWIGLETLHQLTKDGGRRVRWEFSDWDGNWYWSENAGFSVSNASDKFRATMSAVDASRSNVGQYPPTHDWNIGGKMFSTPEADNDLSPSNCADERKAGWWFGYCAAFNPNGVYLEPPAALNTVSIFYFQDGASPYPLVMAYSMRSFECMLDYWM